MKNKSSEIWPRTASRRACLRALGGAGLAAALGRPAQAQDTSQPVRIILPFPPGNALDAMTRILADCLHQTNHRNYIVDNKPGAAAMIGTAEAARAKPDGSVLLLTTSGHNTNAVLYPKLPYDVSRDFTPITQLALSPGFVLLVRPDSPYHKLEDFVKAAKAKPGTISYGSWGTGNTTHLIGEFFNRAAGIALTHIPYKGSPLNDFFGGHIDVTWFSTSLALPLLQDNKARAIAITFPTRVPELPNVPTLNELGYKDVDIPAWSGVFGPAGMQPAMVQSIYTDIVAATRRPEYLANIKMTGSVIVNLPPPQFAALTQGEVVRYQRQLPPLGIKLE